MIIRREIGEKGQVVIRKDIREFLQLRSGSHVIVEIEKDEVKLKPEEDINEFLEEFFTIARTKGKNLTLKDIRKLEEESYDLH